MNEDVDRPHFFGAGRKELAYLAAKVFLDLGADDGVLKPEFQAEDYMDGKKKTKVMTIDTIDRQRKYVEAQKERGAASPTDLRILFPAPSSPLGANFRAFQD